MSKRTFVQGAVVGALVASVTLLASAAIAGTGIGSVFNLGKTNTVNASSVLQGSTNGGQLNVRNNSTAAQAAGIVVHTADNTKAPFVINSSAKVTHLNADELDGMDSAALQSRITGTCLNHTAIASVNASGAVGCTSSMVYGIHHDPVPNSFDDDFFEPSDLELESQCHLNAPTPHILFWNNSDGGATLNWMYTGGGTVNASGVAMMPHQFYAIALGGSHLEGQFIYVNADWAVTVNLHVFDGGTFCEFAGTAEVAKTS